MRYQKIHYQRRPNSGRGAEQSMMSFIWIFMMKILKNIFREKENSMLSKLSTFSNKYSKVFSSFIKLELCIGTSNQLILWLKLWVMELSKPNLLILVNQLMPLFLLIPRKFLDSQLSMLPSNVLTPAKKVSIQGKLIYGLLAWWCTSWQPTVCL